MKSLLLTLLILMIFITGCFEKEETLKYTDGTVTQKQIDELQLKPVSNYVAPLADARYGDVNNDHKVNITDLTTLVNVVNDRPEKPKKVYDINGDCEINLNDVWYFANWMFQGGPAPVKPCPKLE